MNGNIFILNVVVCFIFLKVVGSSFGPESDTQNREEWSVFS